MSFNQEARNEKMSTRFWTLPRVTATLATFALLAMAVSSFNGCDNNNAASNSNANGNSGGGLTASRSVTVAGGGNNNAAPTTPVALVPLSTELLNTPITGVDGQTFKLADYHGKVVVLDLWATWCGPCRQEIPHLLEISREFQSRGVEVVGLTTENPTTAAEAVRAFAQELNITYRLGWADAAVASTLMAGRNVIPQTFVITRDGRVLRRFVGFSPQLAPAMRQAIEQALAAS